MLKGAPNKRYSAEFKTKVIETLREEGLNYSEAEQCFGIESHTLLKILERIYCISALWQPSRVTYQPVCGAVHIVLLTALSPVRRATSLPRNI